MEWPCIPVELVPKGQFQPPFCPRPHCPAHKAKGTFRWHRHSSYTRAAFPHVVSRFRCLTCGGTFSQLAFSTVYYLKRPDLLAPIAAGLLAGSAHRQLARSLGCAHDTVTRMSARLGRHAILLQALSLQALSAIHEPVVYDDFETFAYSQDLPIAVGTATGQRSWFVYSLQAARHRRVGRLSSAQRARKRNTRSFPGSYRASFARLLHQLAPKRAPGRLLRLVTDGHEAYRQAVQGSRVRSAIDHRAFPNPPRGPKGSVRSRTAIERDRQMFAADILHKLIRHSMAHHRRETIAFCQRHNALLERMFLMGIWRNWIKARTERKPDATTPAMWLGLADRPWSWSRVLAQRLFPSRISLPESWDETYRRESTTPEVGVNQRHRLRHAF